jgi:urease accessory protein UreH
MAATPSRHGKGRAIVLVSGREASFSELSYAYPLKLLSPGTISSSSAVPTAIAYILSYGGGLVSGDRIELGVDVRGGAALLLLTQVSINAFARSNTPHRSLSLLSVGLNEGIQKPPKDRACPCKPTFLKRR